jgi:hypothetical protein
VERAGGEQDGGEPGDECELRESEQPDSDHFAGQEVAWRHSRQEQLSDAVVLLLHDATDDPLPINSKGHEQQDGGGDRDEDRRVGGRGFRRLERLPA